MNYTRKKKRYRRMMRRMIWRGTICLAGILFLAGIWKLTSFALWSLTPSADISEKAEIDLSVENQKSEPTFTADTKKEDILLVNKDFPLDRTYQPTLKRMRDYGVEVDASIYDALYEMLSAGEKEGLSFWVASGYRSQERQRELLDEDIELLVGQGYSYSEAYEETVKETMPVGCSEHATGLAVDIVAKDYQILDSKQAATDEIKWLQKNCSRYGFILRYPEDKEDITKVSYESWHFRYVGVDAAKEITSKHITLEEYLAE